MWGALLGAGLGAIAGSQGKQASSTSVQSMQLQDIDKLNQGRSALEATTDQASLTGFRDLQSLLQAGPGQAEVAAGLGAQQDFASRIQQVLNQGGVDIAGGQQFAQQIFAPQQVAMQQAFQDQEIQANRLAARLGRPGTDPILRNKLAQEQTRQQAALQAQQGAFAAQQAREIPRMQLGYAEALAGVRSGLASQAFQNRQALMQMGQQLTASERQYRMGTATTTNQQQQSSGGGLGGAIAGGLAGIGAAPQFAQLGSMFGSWFGGGGQQMAQPGATGQMPGWLNT